MNSKQGGSADHPLCENLLSFALAPIFFCQPTTIYLIVNAAEDCRPALAIVGAFKARSHGLSPHSKKSHWFLFFFNLSLIQVDLIVSHW